jgi:hypothetical protein
MVMDALRVFISRNRSIGTRIHRELAEILVFVFTHGRLKGFYTPKQKYRNKNPSGAY